MRCLLLVMCTHPFAKEALTLHLARSEGHERYFGCNLTHRKVLVSFHQHLMAEAPVVERIRGVRPNSWVPHIEASKFEGGTAFVTFDDHRRGDNTPYVFKTMDYGNTWTSLVTADIEPFNFVHVIEQDPVLCQNSALGG